jgi:glutamine cyclotransferase
MRLPITLALLLLACSQANAAPVQPCKVVARLPHSTSSYTEGFFFRDGLFYEGTGLKGHSQILVYKPGGQPLRHFDVPAEYFGEGIVDFGETLYEWTWQSHTGFILDRTSLTPIRQFHYEGEGWGMTRNDREIITSDGSPFLRFRNPATFDITRSITVRDGLTPVRDLNELEWVKGEIFANVWHSDRIARIDPATGNILAWINCAGLLPTAQRPDPESVLNGIAYDARSGRLYVTGKQWPTIFEIRFVAPK